MTSLGWVDAPEHATGEPLILLLPSLGTTSRMFDTFREALRENLPAAGVARIDLPGHGTGRPAEHVSIGALAREVAERIVAVAARPVVVIGVSMGGAIAFELARIRPSNLSGIVMINSSIRFGTAEGWQQLIDTVGRDGTAGLVSGSAVGWFSPEFVGEDAASAILRDIVRIDPATYIACCRALAAYQGRDAAEVRVPTLLVGTSDDAATPPHGLREVASALPGAEYHELPAGRHLSIVEHAQDVAGLVARWLPRAAT